GALSNLAVIDCDTPESVEYVESNLPKTPWVSITGRGKQFFYRYPEWYVKTRSLLEIAPSLIADIKGAGGYVLAPGCFHYSGVYYRKDHPWRGTQTDLPIFPLPPEPPKAASAIFLQGTGAFDEDEISEVLALLPVEAIGESYDDWLRLGM